MMPVDPADDFFNEIAKRLAAQNKLSTLQKGLLSQQDFIRKEGEKLSEKQMLREMFENKLMRRAEIIKRYMILKGLDKAGTAGIGLVSKTLSPLMAAPVGFDLANTGMNYAAQNMGIPQTVGMLENQQQDLANMQRRRALLQGGQ